MESPAIRCQMSTRSRPSERSIQGSRVASSNPTIAQAEVRMPESDAAPRQKSCVMEFQPSLTAHTPTMTPMKKSKNRATSESIARVVVAGARARAGEAARFLVSGCAVIVLIGVALFFLGSTVRIGR